MTTVAEKITSIPGGNFTAVQTDSGSWNIQHVPIFAGHIVPGTEGTESERFIGRKWMEAAVARAQFLREKNDYLAPLHIKHHGTGETPKPAGFILPVSVEPMNFHGETQDVMFADLVEIPDSVYQDIKANRLPFRSVEIFDLDKPEIGSLALLDTEVPFFQFPLLTIGKEKRAKKTKRGNVGYKVRIRDAAPVLAYSRNGNRHRFLTSFDPAGAGFWITYEQVKSICPACARDMDKRNIRALRYQGDIASLPDQLRDGLAKKFSPAEGFFGRCMSSSLGGFEPTSKEGFCADLTKFSAGETLNKEMAQMADEEKKKDEEQEEEKMALEFQDEEEAPLEDESSDVSLNDLAAMLSEILSIMKGKEEEEESEMPDDEEEPVPVELSADGSVSASKYAAACARIDRLEAKDKARDEKDKVNRIVAAAVDKLSPYNLGTDIEKRIRTLAKESGEKAVSFYVDEMQRALDETPPSYSDFLGRAGAAVETEEPDFLRQYSEQGPEKYAEAREAYKVYEAARQMSPGMKTSPESFVANEIKRNRNGRS